MALWLKREGQLLCLILKTEAVILEGLDERVLVANLAALRLDVLLGLGDLLIGSGVLEGNLTW